MNIKITNHVIDLTPRLRERIEQRVGIAMGRYADRINTVAVRFVSVTLPDKSSENRCHIDVTMCKSVMVEIGDEDVFASVDRAIDNATRRIALAIASEIPGDGKA